MLDTPELQAAIIEWDVASWSVALATWHAALPDLEGQPALEVGGRTGGMSLFLALRGAKVTCSDLDDPAARARSKHRRFGVAERIHYQAADVTSLPFANDTFQVVAFKSLLGALRTPERQQLAVRELHRVLKPGGLLLFAENLTASPLHRGLRRLFVPWGRYWRYLSREELGGMLAAFSEARLESTGFWAAFGRTERQRAWLSRWDPLTCRLLPEAWRYVGYGWARK